MNTFLIYNEKVTESDIDNIDVRSQLERKIQNLELKDLVIAKYDSMTIFFYETTGLKR